jgi:inosine-uridine nucleoside N-ribohydrolase
MGANATAAAAAPVMKIGARSLVIMGGSSFPGVVTFL